MADQLMNCNMANTLFPENISGVKEDEFDFLDDKVHVSETAIIVKNFEIQDHIKHDKIKQEEISSILDNVKPGFPEAQNNMIDNSVKIEEGISADDIKMEHNKGLLYCEDCQAHYEDYCISCGMLSHILNKTALSNANNETQNELPNAILDIQYSFGQFRIFALKLIPTGVKFGPFTGLNRSECPWKIKGGKFVFNDDQSICLNWMQYINPARNSSEKNLLVIGCEDNLYYLSTRQIQAGDELLVYFGEEYEDSVNKNLEVDFNPAAEHIFKDVFACTFCCLGFSTIPYLVKHKTICIKDAAGNFSIEEFMQCPFCKIYLGQNEYIQHHMAHCCIRNDRKCIPPTLVNHSVAAHGCKRRHSQMSKCEQSRYRAKCKADEIKQFNCSLCNYGAKYKQLLINHIKTKHLGECDYKCDRCEYKTQVKTNLQGHIKTKHLKEFRYKCEKCEFKTNVKNNLEFHIKTIHLKKFDYKCDLCEFRTNQKHHLEKHTKTKHLKEFNYNCDLCEFKTNEKNNLEHHIKTKHLKEFDHVCDSCEFRTNRKIDFQVHIKTKHLKEFDYKCDSCKFRTNKKLKLDVHIKTIHLKEYDYKCDMCDHRTNMRWNLTRHIRTKHLKEFSSKCELTYKCDMCDYKTNMKTNLKRHLKTKHLKEFDYKCDSCEFKTNAKAHLEVHVKTKHLKEFDYKCDLCGLRTNRKIDLEKHIERIHLKVITYKCNLCDYKTNVTSNLNRHLKTKHLKEYEFKCDLCEFRTNRKTDLEIHIDRKHLKVHRYKCDMCHYKTNLKSNFNRHIKAKHFERINPMK